MPLKYPGVTVVSDASQITAGPMDVCKTPTPDGPVPIPYANMVDGLAAAGDPKAKKVQKKLTEGTKYKSATGASLNTSVGDQAGKVKGVVSSKHTGHSPFSMTNSKVKVEGAAVNRMQALTQTNKKNVML